MFTNDAITAIARRTLDNKSGARGLRAIMVCVLTRVYNMAVANTLYTLGINNHQNHHTYHIV